MRRPEPTQEELRSAWQRCRTPTWPATFQDAMADALLSRLVRLHALHPPRAHRRQPAAAQPARPRITPPRPAGYFDGKRAAAGERDDD